MPKKHARTPSASATLFSGKKEMGKACIAKLTRQAPDTPAARGRTAADFNDEPNSRAETERILLDYARKVGS